MGKMIKLNSLRVDQLNKLLQNQGAAFMGNKTAKVLELIEIYGPEDVDAEEVEEITEMSAMQKQMDEMRDMISGLAKSVSDLVAVQAAMCTTPQHEINNTATTIGLSPLGTTTQSEWKRSTVHEINGLLTHRNVNCGAIYRKGNAITTGIWLVNKQTEQSQGGV
ncbi:uncharacterized protein LOC126751687 [Bactrocera neohumeralis]|uniref:uncharacterized protein LOC126751687 n=1 Tax=Bactrocera neohumeralis TaxID=98809 RepID=UPI0021662AC4|nr:uncharacterized protein LOC126751687 [Bactrocera neohumeralis]